MIEFQPVDTIWILFCTCLLVFMQAGFSCLEAGAVRTKNNVNVVMKNFADLCLSFLIFALVGFGLMFEGEWRSIITLSIFQQNNSHIYVIFLYQAMFCATAITIVSGAVAERMKFNGYLFLASVVAAMIYPIVGNWIWGGALSTVTKSGWLAIKGFHDFAGATVVHSVGGWIALAAVLVIGPRIGRFGDNADNIESSSLPLSSLGVFLLWIGWLGFNGGSSLQMDAKTPLILLITMIGGVSGIFSALLYSHIMYKKAMVMLVMNGGLAGLVSVTGAADLISIHHALYIGLIAGLLPGFVGILLNKFEIDDAIGAIPVHLTGGVWGTLVAGFHVELVTSQSRFDAIWVQLIGIFSVGAFVFISTFLILKLVNIWFNFRVSEEAELVGLNLYEHGVADAQLDLIKHMSQQIEKGDFSDKAEFDSQSSSHAFASFYNEIITKFGELQDQKDRALKKAQWQAQRDSLSGLLNRRAFTIALEEEKARLKNTTHSSVLCIVDVDLFKSINDEFGHDAGDSAICQISDLLKSGIRRDDTVGRVGGEEFCILFTQTPLEKATEILEKLRNEISQTPLIYESQNIKLTVSIGVTEIVADDSISQSLKRADIALYRAKKHGRNQVISYF